MNPNRLNIILETVFMVLVTLVIIAIICIIQEDRKVIRTNATDVMPSNRLFEMVYPDGTTVVDSLYHGGTYEPIR